MKQWGVNSCCVIKNAHKKGKYRRKSDSQYVQRYRCKSCGHGFSSSTQSPLRYQKTRHLNHKCLLLLASNMSMRRIASLLNIDLKTVARKLAFLGQSCEEKLQADLSLYSGIQVIEFDELQTIEHSKCKPVSVSMVVSKKGRKILGFRVSKMPATGHLAKVAKKKYGFRADERVENMQDLFSDLSKVLPKSIQINSDQCPYYADIVSRFFPNARYSQYKGVRGSLTGQGELKKTSFDPIFAINHSFAMLRANISRLIRKTWCTTKKLTALSQHISIYSWVHNNLLTPKYTVF